MVGLGWGFVIIFAKIKQKAPYVFLFFPILPCDIVVVVPPKLVVMVVHKRDTINKFRVSFSM